MIVHICLDKLKTLPFHVSLPLTAYTNAPVANRRNLDDRVRLTTLPTGWSVASDSGSETTLYKVQCTSAPHCILTSSIVIHDNLTWTLTMGSTPVIPSLIPSAPSAFICLQQVVDLLIMVDKSKLCIGNPDEQYSCLTQHHHGNLYDQSGKLNFDNNHNTVYATATIC